MNYHDCAKGLAREAFEQNFASRRGNGEWADDAGTVIGFYVYDNNPWQRDPELRGRHYAGLVAVLDARGCRVVGEGSYSDDYTIAKIFVSATPERVPLDRKAAVDFLSRCVRDVYETPVAS